MIWKYGLICKLGNNQIISAREFQPVQLLFLPTKLPKYHARDHHKMTQLARKKTTLSIKYLSDKLISTQIVTTLISGVILLEKWEDNSQ